MDKSDLVRRTQKAAWRSAGKIPVSTQRAWYNDDMAELGRMRKPASNPKHADERIEGWGEFLTRPMAIIILTILTSALILIALLWQDGKFDDLLREPVERESKSWMRGIPDGKAPAAKSAPAQVIERAETNEMERVLEEQRAEAAALRAAAIAAANAEPDPALIAE